jgi:cytidylate kinase
MAVITIARQFGAGGRTLGKRVAKELDYKFFDDAIIQELSQKVRVSKNTVKDMERTAGSMFSKIVSSALSRSYMERLMGKDIGYMDENIYVETLREIITEIAETDNVVILGRGGQYILGDRENTYHFLLVAQEADRIAFMQNFYEYSERKALQAVLNGEKRRRNLYAKFGKTDYNQPELYHSVFNMSKLSLNQALAQICALVRSQ